MHIRSFFFIILGMAGCVSNQNPNLKNLNQNKPNHSFKPNDFINVLEVRNTPKQAEDWTAFSFADQGAWFSFALPEYNSQTHAASFPGPFIMTHGLWFSDLANQFFVEERISKKQVNFAQALEKAVHYFPGRLSQYYRTENLELTLDLLFTSNRSSLIRAQLKNLSQDVLDLKLGWRGKPFQDAPIEVTHEEDKIIFTIAENGGKFIFQSPNMEAQPDDFQKQGFALYKIDSLQVEEIKIYGLTMSYIMESKDMQPIEASNLEAITSMDEVFKQGDSRWTNYINDALNSCTEWSENVAYQRIAIKSLMTLINNWRSAYGDLHFDGLFPSYAVSYFNGFWAWDSWKHSVALARFHPQLAKDQIRTMFAYQDEQGMVADVIYANKSWNNWRDSKPPLASWSVWEVYLQTKDQDFIKEMFPKLLKYHRWWYKHRDHDQNGLCEYGSTNGTLIAALWESGMDDAVRFDNRSMLKNTESSWSLDLESVDLNAYLYKDKLHLAQMASILGMNDVALQFKAEAEGLKRKIQEHMFDEQTGYFNDINIEDKSKIVAEGPEGWIPLWTGVATKEQAARVRKVLLNPDKFSTYMPFPTIARDNPRYLTGYWRGPVWIDQAYFAIKGLETYGFQEEADRYILELFDRAEGLKNATGPIRENYHPENGQGLKVNHFSWSAAHFLLLFRGE